ncbi:MAG: ABC transporter ATP-binding protein, partial [Polyangiales bacterium]
SVARGEVVGFLGPNGAGKSTTLRILAGFLGATSGRAVIDGHDVVLDPDGARRKTGYMPEAVPLYGEMRVREYLRFRAELKRVPSRERKAAVGRAMELARVDDVADTLIEHLSKGYRQRVGLADALVSKPPLLVLDEPTAGMDPNQIREVRALIRSLGGEQTVLLSTHILSEVEATCARVLVIDRGRLVAEGTPKSLGKLRGAQRLELVVRAKEEHSHPAAAIHGMEATKVLEITRQGGDVFLVVLELDHDADVGAAAEVAVARLIKGKFAVREVTPGKASLEDVFAAVTGIDDAIDDAIDEPDAAPKEEAKP